MEELRETAMIYYRKVPNKVKKLVKDFFKAMDDNGDGKIELHEFAAFMKEEGYEALNNPLVFVQINVDKSGRLSFEDVVTLFYIINTGRTVCDGCREFIVGLYFTCVKCFHEKKSFCLHPKCFSDGKYVHHEHADHFLDNHALLEKLKQKTEVLDANPVGKKAHISASSSSTALQIVPASKLRKMKKALKALEAAIGIGNIASIFSTIM